MISLQGVLRTKVHEFAMAVAVAIHADHARRYCRSSQSHCTGRNCAGKAQPVTGAARLARIRRNG